jgi:hypothetical protein
MHANHGKQADAKASASAKSQAHPSWWREDAHGKDWIDSGERVLHSWDHPRSREPVDANGGMADGGNIQGDDLSGGKVEPVLNGSGRDRGANGGESLFNQAMPDQKGRDDNATTPNQTVQGVGNETPLRFVVGARREFGEAFPKWSNELERQLRADWILSADGRDFDAVKPQIRHGYEHQDARTASRRA